MTWENAQYYKDVIASSEYLILDYETMVMGMGKDALLKELLQAIKYAAPVCIQEEMNSLEDVERFAKESAKMAGLYLTIYNNNRGQMKK